MFRRKQWLYAILISTIQLALMLLGVLWLFSSYGDTTNRIMHRQLAMSNQALASQSVNQIRSMHLEQIRPGEPNWNQLQSMIEESSVPNHGFVAIADAHTGKFLCHPEIRSNPKIQTQSWWFDRECLAPTANNGNSPMLPPLDPSVSFVLHTKAGSSIVNGHHIPELNAVLLVYQRHSFAMAMNAILTKPLSQFGCAFTLIIGMAGTTLSLLILRRFESQVDTKERDWERRTAARSAELLKTKKAVIFGLARLAESRDNDTGEHLERIRQYVLILAKHLAKTHSQIDQEFINNLGLAASLHDIGKVGIPDAILLKPGGLNPTERSIMELHTVIGGECLEAISDRLGESDFLDMACQVAYWHHERWDGAGYPHGLSEQQIPIVARIVAVADVYDALTSRRPYKQPVSHLESRMIITAGAGNQFDPEVVLAFQAHESEFEHIAVKHHQLSDEELTCQIAKQTIRLQELSQIDH